MAFLDEIIKKFGRETVMIVGIILLAIIIFIIVYKMMKLKVYRKEIVHLENNMNAVKTLPIQYRLGRVKGIAKNMPDVVEKYEEYSQEYKEICDFQNNEIVSLLTDVDESLFYRKISGVGKKLNLLKEKIDEYEKRSKNLLEKIEVITEIENIQRLEIIKVKEKYRETNDSYTAVRFKIEEFVPAIPAIFADIDQRFVKLEDYMNNQKFDEAKEYTEQIEKDIDVLDANIRDLPPYISNVRQYIPKKMEELASIIDSMKERHFALERMNTTTRYNKIVHDLETTVKNIKQLNLENVGQQIEVMTEEMNSLASDFEKEEAAYQAYQEKRNACYKFISDIDQGLNQSIQSLEELESNYILDDYQITIRDDYQGFQKILDELTEITAIIDSQDFSYFEMIENFEEMIEKSRPFHNSLLKYKDIESSLRIQEKRALDELDNINIVLLEIKSEIKNKHLPMISESYKDYIEDSYQKADAILNFIRRRPIDLQSLSTQVDAARDVIYKLYDNVHNLIVTAEMVEDAIVYGNRYRSSFLEVNTELTKAELLFRNGEYTKALSTAVDIIEKIKPGSYEMLINKNSPKNPQ